MEVPDILDWVKPDELLLTTAYPLRDDPVALDALIPRLAERGLAGIALKPGRYIKEIPASMIEAADQHAFALIELPPEASFNEIINSVLTVILDVQAARLQRSAAIHDRFTSIALSGGGLRQIAEALAELVGRPVADRGRPGHGPVAHLGGSAAAASRGWRPDRRRAMPAERSSSRSRSAQSATGRSSSPVTRPRSDPDRLEAIEYAATVAALRQVQTRAVAEADRRFQAVCLEELITGHVVGPDRADGAGRRLRLGSHDVRAPSCWPTWRRSPDGPSPPWLARPRRVPCATDWPRPPGQPRAGGDHLGTESGDRSAGLGRVGRAA